MTARALKLRLDAVLDEAEPDGDSTPDDQALFDDARRRFRDAGPEVLDRVTDDLWSYYRSTAEEFTEQQRSDYGIPELDPSADIWSEVSVTAPPDITVGQSPYSPARCYISFECEVSWEPEHGLQLVVEEGRRVCKLGPYDGHATNAAAFGDLALLDVVFRR